MSKLWWDGLDKHWKQLLLEAADLETISSDKDIDKILDLEKLQIDSDAGLKDLAPLLELKKLQYLGLNYCPKISLEHIINL